MAIVLAVTIFIASFILTLIVRRIAWRFHIVDVPRKERKIHPQPTPLLGGVAVITAILLGIMIAWPWLTKGYLLPKHVSGIVVGMIILLIGGVLDDHKDLPPKKQILFPILAALTIITSGIGIDFISNPFGDVLRLDTINVKLFQINGIPYHLTLFADLFTLLWLCGMMYTTKFLDGLDGLVASMSVIGAVILLIVSISPTVGQPETAMIALIVACAFGGFLLLNWHPATIFLGESGSLVAGFLLGTLAIVSGGKIATTLLVMGIPILDVVWVIVRRVVVERRSPFQADKLHLHFRLLESGIPHRMVVLLLSASAALLGASALVLTSSQKVDMLIVAATIIFFLAAVVRLRHRTTHHPRTPSV